jgi:exodeoxyribonuclease VII small subunit
MGIDELAEQVQKATSLLKTCRQILIKTETQIQEAFASFDGDLESDANRSSEA